MNFTQELTEFQGAIISADNEHTFSKISARGGNEEQILDIVAKLFHFLQGKNYLNENGVTAEGESQMRTYCLYLILNGDMPVLMDMVNMQGIENVIWTIPTINKCLICEIIWGLSMENYLSEILVYCYPKLAIQVLMRFTTYLKHSSPTKCLKQLKSLAASCYKLVCRLHFYNPDEENPLNELLSDIFDYFQRCVNYYLIPPNADRLNQLSEDDHYKFKAYNIQSLLTLTLECLGQFISCEEFEPEGFFPLYLCTLQPSYIKTKSISYRNCDSENKVLLECLNKFNTELLDKCQVLVMQTSVEIFCAWSEFEENGKTMQQTVGELSYMLHDRASKMPSLLEHPLLQMLLQLSRKPADIHDIIESADTNTIIENASKRSKEQILWLKAIIDKENLKGNKQLLDCLLHNVEYLKEVNCEILFKKLQSFTNNVDLVHKDAITLLTIRTYSKLNINTQKEILSEHFSDKVFHNTLQSVDFENMITELFNKLTASLDYNSCNVYDVFIQNPLEFYLKVFRSATDDLRQDIPMTHIMRKLEPFMCHYYSLDTVPTIVKVIENVSQCYIHTEAQTRNFIKFIKSLKRFSLISSAKLLVLVIMPGVHKAVLNSDVKLIAVHVKLLKDAYSQEELLEYRAPLLAMISQIIEVVRWTFSTFVPDAPAALEETLQLQMNIFNTYPSNIPDKEKKWLKGILKKNNPLNMYYYKRLWNSIGLNYLENISGQLILTIDKTIVLLAKILGVLTPREWCMVWDSLTCHGCDTTLHIMFHAVILINGTVMNNRDANKWALLLYCYRNFVSIIKDKYLKVPLTDSSVRIVLDKLLHIINGSEADDMGEIGLILLPVYTYIHDYRSDLTIQLTCIGNRIKHGNFASIVNSLFAINHLNMQ